MSQASGGRILIACAAVSLLSLWGVANFYVSTADATGPNADVYKIGAQASRFQDLAAALPSTGVIGYVSDVSTGQTLGAVLYASAQYTLAPRLVTDQATEPAPEWVVGDFSKPLDVAQFGAQRGLTLVKDFGNGAVLYRRQRP